MIGFVLAAALMISPPSWAVEQDPEPPASLPGDPLERVAPELRDRMRLHDSAQDDWDTETFQSQASSALKKLGEAWMAEDSAAALGALKFLAADLQLQGWANAPGPWSELDGGVLQTRTWTASDVATELDLAATFHAYGAPQRFKAKIHKVQRSEQAIRTVVDVQMVEPGDAHFREVHARWNCDWTWTPGDAAPKLIALAFVSATEVRRAQPEPMFADVTRAQFAETKLYDNLLRPGLMDWKRRIAASLGISDRSQQGMAIGDIDGDGWEEIYLPQPAGLPNLLLRRRPDGRLEDIAAWAGVDFLDSTRTGLLLDLDNDGDLDLVTNLAAELVFLSNDGDGRFQVRTSGLAPESTMLTAADYNGDGFLDIYACRYLNPYENQGVPLPYHDAENGYPNVLLENDGAWTVRDVTEEVGLGANNSRFSFAAAWEDYDNDGDLDLYVANDFGRNNLYRNDGGRFIDVAAAAGVEDLSAGMGVSWADYDGDGWMDLLVSNMYSSAGNRVAYQRSFQTAADGEDLSGFRRHARGNSLFRNRGDGTFEDRSLAEGVTMGRWAWGSIFLDVSNDGRPDIFVPNGFITSQRPDDL